MSYNRGGKRGKPNNFYGNSRGGYNDDRGFNESKNAKCKTVMKEYSDNNNEQSNKMEEDIVLEANDEIIETLIIFPGEKYPFNQELLTQGNFYLETNTEKNNDGEDNKFLRSKNFFSLSVCKSENNKFNMGSQLQGKYYSPKIDDMIVGTIIGKNMDQYKVDINSYIPAVLGTSEFEGATKKTKPNLKIGDLVFAKVVKTNKFDSPILSCISGDGKTWSSGEAFFGVINHGHTFKVPLNMVNLYFYFGEKLFSRINDAVEYEYNLGHNGTMVVNCENFTMIPKIKDLIKDWGKMMLEQINKGVKLNDDNTWNPELEKALNKNFIQK